MRRFLVLSCVLAQVLVLAWLAAGREYVVRYGETARCGAVHAIFRRSGCLSPLRRPAGPR